MIRVAYCCFFVASGTVGIFLEDRPAGHVTHLVGSLRTAPGDMSHILWGHGRCDTCRGVMAKRAKGSVHVLLAIIPLQQLPILGDRPAGHATHVVEPLGSAPGDM